MGGFELSLTYVVGFGDEEDDKTVSKSGSGNVRIGKEMGLGLGEGVVSAVFLDGPATLVPSESGLRPSAISGVVRLLRPSAESADPVIRIAFESTDKLPAT